MKTTFLLWCGVALFCSACTNSNTPTDLINKEASLPADFNFNKLGLKVITSSVNIKKHTMSTLYGNDFSRKRSAEGRTSVAPGEVLALVTWQQKDDDQWFGAKVPGELLSVEMVKTVAVNGGQTKVDYERFEGKKLSLNSDTLHHQESIKYIFDQKPSVMP